MLGNEDPKQLSLEGLVSEKFGDLTAAERSLLGAASLGESANCGVIAKGPNAPENDPAQASAWGSERQIRATLIRWLCVDAKAAKLVEVRGLTVACAKIVGELDLAAATVAFPLIFFKCSFPEGLNLLYADLFLLNLDGCAVQRNPQGRMAINADSLRVRSLYLRNGFRTNGLLQLRGAEIAGNLECDGQISQTHMGKC